MVMGHEFMGIVEERGENIDDVAKGYEIFNKKEDGCVKVVLDPWK